MAAKGEVCAQLHVLDDVAGSQVGLPKDFPREGHPRSGQQAWQPEAVESAGPNLVLKDHRERRQPASRVFFLASPDQINTLGRSAGRGGLTDQGIQRAGSQ
jgi:hypothetical protein